MPFILDTNIVINCVRDSNVWKIINDKYFQNKLKGNARASVVTLAESKVFAKRNRWGREKSKHLTHLLNTLEPISFSDSIIKNYIEIDLYSQNQHKSLSLPKNLSARNMGKNDIWIAATAATFNFPLITTDKDFNHLHDVFLDVIYIDIEMILKNR